MNEVNYWILPVVATCSAIVVGWMYQKKKRSQQCNTNKSTSDEIVVELLPVETSRNLTTMPSIATITWYEGDLDSIKDDLRQRVSDILQANPWLQGRLVTRNGKIVLVYPKAKKNINPDTNGYFTIATATANLTHNTSYFSWQPLIEPFMVKKGVHIFDKQDELLFRVSLVPDSQHPSTRFALITSFSHMIGDGFTYYKLHNMLSSDKKIESLSVKRKIELQRKMEQALGRPVWVPVLRQVGLAVRMLINVLLSYLLGPRSTHTIFWVNEDWLQKQKQIATENNKDKGFFVSSNDILTAFGFQCIQCDPGAMAVNFRNKLENCLETDAGNYVHILTCRPEDYTSPSVVRAVVNDLHTGKLLKPTVMTPWEHLKSRTPCAIISNWSTFSQPVLLNGCVQELHIPPDPKSNWSPSRAFSVMIIFRPGVNRRAAILISGHPRIFESMQARGMVGEIIK